MDGVPGLHQPRRRTGDPRAAVARRRLTTSEPAHGRRDRDNLRRTGVRTGAWNGKEGKVAQVRVPRKGVTQTELIAVLSRRLDGNYQVEVDGGGGVTIRRGTLSGAVVRIRDVPGATVFRVRGGGLPVYRMGTARRVADVLRRSPEFRTV